jgi:hypothetical protein
MRLIEGEPVETLKPQLEDPYASHWGRIVDACVSTRAPTIPDGSLQSLVDRLNQTLDPAERIPLLREALQLANREKDPWFWGQMQLSLAQGLAELPVGDRRQQLEDAIAAYNLAMKVTKRETSPEAWAYIKMRLAMRSNHALRAIKRRISRTQSRSIKKRSRSTHTRPNPGEWALTNMNLGIALYNRKTGDATENVERAISVLGCSRFDHHAGKRARRVGKTDGEYRQRVHEAREGRSWENIEFAVRSLRQALSIITPQHAPAMWVTVAINLAWAESERTSGDRLQNLEEAQRTLLAAERLCNPRTAPDDWIRLSLSLNEVLQKTIPLLRDDPAKQAGAIKEACRRIWKLYGDTGESARVRDNALRTFTLAVELTPEESPDLPMYLVRQGIFLEDTAKVDKSVAGLDQAMAGPVRRAETGCQPV